MTVPLPWWAKISAKLVLARLPLPTAFWQKLGLFRHGAMDKPTYALSIFQNHFARWQNPPANWTCLELGPGDSLFTALIAKAYGAQKIYLIDSGDYAVRDLAPYQAMAAKLREQGKAVPTFKTFDEMLKACHATYLTAGLSSLETVLTGSIDFTFSNAVLEHVRRREFAATMLELARVQKPGGLQSHAVDLRDHLQNSLNNLRFPERVWESEFFARSGFYTNRLRHSEIETAMQSAGFKVEEVGRTTWATLPLPREKMSAPFRDFSDEDHQVSTFDVILRAA